MYQDTNLQNYLEQSSSVSLQSLVIAEWNLNFSDNILRLGNYRNRPENTFTGLTATITSGQNTVTVADTSVFLVGQLLTKTSGVGVFGASPIITQINSATQITVSVNHVTSGAITFSTSQNPHTYISTETISTRNAGWYNATDSEIVVNTGLNTSTSKPTTFMTKNDTEKILYSLTDCISRFRPRSGINKVRYFKNNYLNFSDEYLFLQPRYYLSSKDDKFKYWGSYRVEGSKYLTSISKTATVTAGSTTIVASSVDGLVKGQPITQTSTVGGSLGANPIIVDIYPETSEIVLSVSSTASGSVSFTANDFTAIERGISKNKKGTGEYYIDDAAPFVVYDKLVPANRIVVKMQTHASDFDRGTFTRSTNSTFTDPFYENPSNTGAMVNQETPEDWKIQYLDANNVWQDAKVFTTSSTRSTGKRIVGADGYVELAYGITNTLPTGFRDLGQYPSLASLPINADVGDAYLVTGAGTGTYYVWNGTDWTTDQFVPIYGWYVKEEDETLQTSKVTNLTSPEFYGTPTTIYDATYREFQFIKGIRIVVNTMSKRDSIFELIEMSPRLVANMSDRTKEYSITKIASDIGNTGIPVGQLSAATGNVSLFDYDQAFNQYNELVLSGGDITGSIVYNINSKNLQFKFYEQIIDNRNANILDYFVPIKTMYVDGFPSVSKEDRAMNIELRDLFFHFESMIAPSLLMQNVKLSKAIATLLDNIGFTNYKFYRNENEKDDVIPYFYIAPDTSVSDVLNDLAQSTQTAMFFDEYNNFIAMSKNYIMPTTGQRSTDIVLYGTKDFQKDGAFRNEYNNPSATNSQLANIMSIASEDNQVFNGGKVTYSNKYIQKSYGTIKEASFLNNSQSFKYKPVLLWEVSGTELLRPTNEEVGNQSSYALSALPLNVELTGNLPTVSGGVIIDNVMDFGESIYWLTRYEGYLYANGEIIKYKGVEHAIQGATISGLEATISSSQNTFILTTGNIYNLSLGQILTKTGGTGTFGAQCIITGIDRNKKIITVSVNHTGSGAITFSAVPLSTNVWVENVDDYQKYFAKVKFNGKIFPTGRVKIYAEPDFDANGNVKEGAVAKHGRMQFGTGVYNQTTKGLVPATHSILNSSNEWMQPSKAKAFQMKSEWLFKNNHQYTQTKYTLTSVTGAGSQKVITLTSGNTKGMKKGWLVSGTNVAADSVIEKLTNTTITLNKNLTGSVAGQTITVVNRKIETLSVGNIATLTPKPTTKDTVKNMFDTSYFTESASTQTKDKSKTNGSIKSSALIIDGVKNTNGNSNDYLSYVFKDYSGSVPSANVFGTRMRVLGKRTDNDDDNKTFNQEAIGADIIESPKDKKSIYGTGGGLAIGLDTTTNKHTGYYFEILALSRESISEESGENKYSETVPNVYFYKVLKDATNNTAIPVTLWYGTAPILVDDGTFPGMGKIVGKEVSTVYDLSVKVEEVSGARVFHLYLDNKLITTVTDTDPIPVTENTKNLALFVRGGGSSMFEHVYAIQDSKFNQFEKTSSPLYERVETKESFSSDAWKKYLLNPTVIDSYLGGINTSGQKTKEIYYEEFGTIMRECSYFNVRYDKAYPALYSQISPTFNEQQGYVVSGFRANPYSAEFLVFNVTDFALNLDESSGNYLRIQGITFTQQSAHDLTVDEYFTNASSLNNYNNYTKLNSRYVDIQNSRNTYGKNEFTIAGTYIQNIDMATSLMDWMVDKIMVPKKSICVEIFANPMIQLGDIVTIEYSIDGVEQLPDSRFVVYHTEYSRNSNGPSMTLYLSEVL